MHHKKSGAIMEDHHGGEKIRSRVALVPPLNKLASPPAWWLKSTCRRFKGPSASLTWIKTEMEQIQHHGRGERVQAPHHQTLPPPAWWGSTPAELWMDACHPIKYTSELKLCQCKRTGQCTNFGYFYVFNTAQIWTLYSIHPAFKKHTMYQRYNCHT